MIKYEDHCCDCGIHCRGNACKNRHVPVHYCDKCGYEVDGVVYEADEYDDLCEECLKELFKKR